MTQKQEKQEEILMVKGTEHPEERIPFYKLKDGGLVMPQLDKEAESINCNQVAMTFLMGEPFSYCALKRKEYPKHCDKCPERKKQTERTEEWKK